MNPIIERKKELNSTSIFSIRLRRVAFQIKHSILLWLALVLVSLCLCVMSQAVCYSKARTYYTSRLRWAFEEKIAERIDANLLNVNIQNITDLPKAMFEKKVHKLKKKTEGELIIKEYPTASAHAGHFKALLNELSLKKSFKPDIIFIDYSKHMCIIKIQSKQQC